MSSSYSTGYYAKEAEKIGEEPCQCGGPHVWVRKGFPPSHWDECKKCKTCRYFK